MNNNLEMVCPFNEFKPCYKYQCPFYKPYIKKSSASGYWKRITVYEFCQNKCLYNYKHINYVCSNPCEFGFSSSTKNKPFKTKDGKYILINESEYNNG